MAKYQQYEQYKDSGVEWLGKIPIHWEVIKCSNIFSTTKGENAAQLTNEYCASQESIYPVFSGKTENNGLMGMIDTFEFDYSNSGCILSTTVGAKAMTVKYLAGKFSLSQNCMIIFPRENKKYNTKFYFYFFQPLFSFFRNQIPDYMQPSFRMEDFASYRAVNLDVREQAQIANFLDHETAQIDTLIEKQQTLIQLLKEKRQAVISHAVTKGLNPDALMKDSGVEWLGDVPEHWGFRSLRYVGNCQNGINIGAEFFGSGHPFVSYGDAYRNPQLPKTVEGLVQSTEKDRISYSVRRGDVIFTRTSETIEEIGLASTCLMDIEDATFAGFLIRFRPFTSVLHPEFSKYYFRSSKLRFFFVNEMNIVTRASLSQELLKKLPVLLPPIEEQVKIAEKLYEQEVIFEKLIENAFNAIQLMQERRTALISAAVTGKIDVRGWQKKQNN